MLVLTILPCNVGLQALLTAFSLSSKLEMTEEDGSVDERGKAQDGSTVAAGRMAEDEVAVQL